MYPVLLVIAMVTVVSLGCQQTATDDFSVKVRFSALVATGEITDSISDTSFQMTLGCILKDSGTQPPAVINITHTSNNFDGRCFTNNFQKGKTYLVFLRYNRPNFTPFYNEEESSKMADVLKVCGLGVVNKYPTGSTPIHNTCPDVQARTCPTTLPPTTTPHKKKPLPALPMTTKNHMENTEKSTVRMTSVRRTTTVNNRNTSPLLASIGSFAENDGKVVPNATVKSPPKATEVKDKNFPDYNNTASQGTENTTWYIMWYIMWYITWHIMCLFHRTYV